MTMKNADCALPRYRVTRRIASNPIMITGGQVITVEERAHAPTAEELEAAARAAAEAAVNASNLRQEVTHAERQAGERLISTEEAKAAARAAEEATAEAIRLGNAARQLAELNRRALLLEERMANDPEYAAEERARIAGHEEDPDLDPRLKELYLNRTIVDNQQVKDLFGVSLQAVWDWSAPLQVDRRPRPHPRMSPTPDVTLKRIGGRAVPGVQLGKMIEWGIWSHRLLWSPRTGKIRKNPNFPRHGRSRKRRTRS